MYAIRSYYAGPLIVDNIDQAQITHLVAGPQHPVHLLFHLGIAALDRIEIELGLVFSLHHRGGSTTAKADPIGRTAHLDNEHPLVV